ncbi:MAG: hypothetical protein V3R66_05790 [Rhodospirillales bacterium]
MTEEENSSQDTGQQEEEAPKFLRGSALSIFHSDRHEDFMALLFAMAVALGVYVTIK